MRFRRKTSTKESTTSTELAPAGAGSRPAASARALAQVIERSYRIQGPAAEAYVARLRDAGGGASPAEVVAKLDRRYVSMVTLGGMAVGAVATIPGIGTLSAVSAAAAETAANARSPADWDTRWSGRGAEPHRRRSRCSVRATSRRCRCFRNSSRRA